MKKPIKGLLILAVILLLVTAAVVPFSAFNTNQFNTAGNVVSIGSGAFTTNINLAGTVAGNPVISGLWTWTNPPQIFKPLQFYQTNLSLTGTVGTTTLTGPAGSFTGWLPGVNLVGNNVQPDQYAITEYLGSTSNIGLASTTQIVVSEALVKNYTGSVVSWQYSSPMVIFTDYNGNYFGTTFDSGGDLLIADGGGGPPAIAFTGHPTSLGGGHIDLKPFSTQAGVFGPKYITIGGNQTYGLNQLDGLNVSTMAPYNSFFVLSNGMVQSKYGITNAEGILKLFAPITLALGQVNGPGTVTISSAGVVTGVGTSFNTTFLTNATFYVATQPYHINTVASDTSATVYENVSAVAGSTYTLNPDSAAFFDQLGVSQNTGIHVTGDGDVMIHENFAEMDLAGGSGVNWQFSDLAGGALSIRSFVTGGTSLGGINLQPNSPNLNMVGLSNGAAQFPGGLQSLAVTAPVAITATGITNNMGVQACAYVTCTNASWTNFNNVPTAVLTNLNITDTNKLFLLQPGGSLRGAGAMSGNMIAL